MIVQDDLQLDLSCLGNNQVAIRFNVPQVFALSEDRSCLIIKSSSAFLDKLQGEASICEFSTIADLGFLKRLYNSNDDTVYLEAISFRSGNSVEKALILSPIKSALERFTESCSI